MRRAARIDANHQLIADAFRSAGCSVHSLAAVGNGCPDLVVGCAGINLLVEVKDPEQPPSARRFTPQQKKWHAEWKGKAHVVETVEQAIMLANYMRGRITRPA